MHEAMRVSEGGIVLGVAGGCRGKWRSNMCLCKCRYTYTHVSIKYMSVRLCMCGCARNRAQLCMPVAELYVQAVSCDFETACIATLMVVYMYTTMTACIATLMVVYMAFDILVRPYFASFPTRLYYLDQTSHH